MNEFRTVFSAVLPVFAIALAGGLMRRWRWLTEEADQSLLRVTINVLSPCLIVDSILHNAALKQWGNILLAPLVGLVTVALGLAVGRLMGRAARLAAPAALGTFALCVGIYNYGYVPVPLTESLFNDRQTMGVLFVHNVGVEIGLWTLGLLALRGGRIREGWRELWNPPLVAILLALALNLAGLEQWLPEFLIKTARMLGLCTIPMGLVLVGATMMDHIHEFRSSSGWRPVVLAVFLRAGLLPLLFLLIARHLPCSLELKRVMVLEAAMPSAVFPIVMAKHYGGDAPLALRIVVVSSLVSLVTIPLWLRLGMHWLGL